jgi:phage/plasmid-associated DNA primase
MHTDNAILTSTSKGLLYICMSTKNKHYLHEVESDFDLCRGGDRGLAKLVAKMKNGDVFNVSGDGSKAEFYVYDKSTCLWAESEASLMKAAVIPCVVPVIQQYLDKYTEEVKRLQKVVNELQSKQKEGARSPALILAESELKGATSIRNELFKVRKDLDLNHKLTAILQLLQHEVRDKTFKAKLDQRKDILSCKKYIIELRTGTTRPRVREDYCSFAIDRELDFNHPLLSKLREIMAQITLSDIEVVRKGKKVKNRPEYLEFLQRLMGYCITGETFLEVFMILIGGGANGKSLLAHWLCQAFGKYYLTGSKHLMESTKHAEQAGGTSSHLMAMYQKRIVLIEELSASLNGNQMKLFSGGGRITARQLHKIQEEFELIAKILGLTNHMVELLEFTIAMKRRLITLPFDAQFRVKDDADEELRYDENNPTHFIRDDTLKSQEGLVDALFAFGVEGAVKFYKDELGQVPDCCNVLKREFEKANDKVQGWIDTECDVSDPKGMYSAVEALYSYKDSMRAAQFVPLEKKEFYAKLQEKGFVYKKYQGEKEYKFHNKWVFVGMKSDS